MQTTYYMGQYQQCIQRVDQLLKENPKDSGLFEIKIKCLIQLDKIPEAQSVLQEKRAILTTELIQNLEAEIFIFQEQPQKAVDLLKQNLKHSLSALNWGKIHLLHDLEGPWVEEIPSETLRWQDWFSLAKIAESKTKYKEASDLYQRALQLQPNQPLLLNNYTWSKLQAGELDQQSLDAIEKARELDPKNLDILDTYVETLIHQKKFDVSLKVLEKNLSLVNGHAKLIYLLALSYEKNFMLEQALNKYRTSLSFADSAKVWSFPIPRNELQAIIKRLEEL
jgi:tetratricopeptide (TPR) repeat protein